MSLGIVGAFLPLIPTTPFLLLSLYFFSRSSEKWSQWILNHKVFGPPIHRWREKRAIKRKVKIWALSVLIASFSLSIYLVSHFVWVASGLFVIFAILFFFLLRLPVNDEELMTPNIITEDSKIHG